MPLPQEEFNRKVTDLTGIGSGGFVACAVSGGPDSMALLALLSRWATPRGVRIVSCTVDHGLRRESAEEAQMVAGWVAAAFPDVIHKILTWVDDKPDSRIMEEARAARYALLREAMTRDGIKHLFVAHHQDDQAETVLIRLAKGSGLDGLCAMREVQRLGDDQWIVRPLLDVSKKRLVEMCDTNNIPYVRDPSNENRHYLRPRLRAAKEILEEEGLSSKRLSVTARRLARARDALESLSDALYASALREDGRDNGVTLDYNVLKASHEELVLRVILKAMDAIHPESGYGPRMEKAESLVARLLRDPEFNGATLGNCRFAIDRKNGAIWIGKE